MHRGTSLHCPAMESQPAHIFAVYSNLSSGTTEYSGEGTHKDNQVQHLSEWPIGRLNP